MEELNVVVSGDGWSICRDGAGALSLTINGPKARLSAGPRSQLTVDLPSDFVDCVLRAKKALRPAPAEGLARYATGWGPDASNGLPCPHCMGTGNIREKYARDISDCLRCGGGGYVPR